jgi:hypothetical protein
MKRLLVCVLLALGCSRSRPEPPPAPPVVGPAAAWAAAVADKHAEADRLIDRGDAEGARRVLASIVEPAAILAGGVAPETRRVLLQDTHFRLARLELDARAPRAAAQQAAQGLALGGGEDLFVANLLVARGTAHEALGETKAALDDYDRALRINEALLREMVPPP